ncbi:MAG: hypothetical protein M1826_000063 [Phylliscum demangeonii]|nr:MAG: hypothetical protein M1826_000063 [Phylliscum demangeonii]
MERLSNELLRDILDHIQTDADHVVHIDRRAYLSVESFKAPSPPLRAQAQDVANFRLVCKRFADLGIPHQFTRVTTRFSRKGFARLEAIASRGAVARQVKKFSYMVPCFFVDGHDRLEQLLQVFRADLGPFDAGHFIRKAGEQRAIVTGQQDLRALTTAMAAFTSLQHVQILRLLDEPDRLLLDFLREHEEVAARYVEMQWTPACVHGTRTLGQALLERRSPFTRFSGPMMNPQSFLALQREPRHQISALARQLTCLELHFDESRQLSHRMRELAGLCQTIFSAATGMLAVHLGFPSRSPLGLGLEEIFHHVHWERLRAFGIQAWRLDADEIVAFVRRHRKTLRGLRLRDVLLKDGSRWKSVLGMVRRESEVLDWVSLRRIGYARAFDEHVAGTMEILPTPAGGVISASDDDDDDDDEDDGGHAGDGEFPPHLNPHDDDDDDDDDHDDHHLGNDLYHHTDDDDDDDEVPSEEDEDEDDDDDDDDEHGPGEANELAMDAPDTPSSVPWCSCHLGRMNGSGNNSNSNPRGVSLTMSDELLDDDGRDVPNWQRKRWEKWVVGRCPEHDLRF